MNVDQMHVKMKIVSIPYRCTLTYFKHVVVNYCQLVNCIHALSRTFHQDMCTLFCI